MDSHHLRTILLKLVDRLNDNDRQRLQFFFQDNIEKQISDDPLFVDTLYRIEYLFDQDKINEQDFIFLINAFEKMQCFDAAKLLREHKRQIETNEINEPIENLSLLIPSLTDQLLQDQDDNYSVLPDLIDETDNPISNVNNLNNNSITVTLDNHNKSSTLSTERMTSTTENYLLLFVILSIIFGGLVLGGLIWFIQLRIRYTNIINEQAKYKQTIVYSNDILLAKEETIQYLENIQRKDNETMMYLEKVLLEKSIKIEDLDRTLELLKEELKLREGFACTAEQRCKNRGLLYGACGNGHTYFCNMEPITESFIGDGCTCDRWCRKHGHKNGGKCGDEYTCICSK